MYSFKDIMQENEFKQVTSTGDTHSSYQDLDEVETSLIPIPFPLMPITFKGRMRQTTRQCEPTVLPTLFPLLFIPHCPSALHMELGCGSVPSSERVPAVMGAFYSGLKAVLSFHLHVSRVRMWKRREETLLDRILQGLSHLLLA